VSDSDHRRLPSIDSLISDPRLGEFSHRAAVAGARQAVDEARNGGGGGDILERAIELASRATESDHQPVINCSGTIMNTGLGRSRLPEAAAQAIERILRSHSSIETNLESGTRGDRQMPLASLLTELTGSEDAYVVNNNAGAVVLAVSTFAQGGSVLLSRGQSVEIGGAFRMPDVVASAGARLIDVGCTNKTRLSDYDDAIEADTRVILRCHPSNFKMSGFVEEPSASELAILAREHGIVIIDDVGSGCLYETTEIGLPHETTLSEAVKTGADVITASGDKLLGGPQAGIILGSRATIARVRKNPLARALRIDKLAAAGIEATLRLCADGKFSDVPTYRALARQLEEITELGNRVVSAVGGSMEDGTCEPGGGSLPGVTLPSKRVSFDSDDPQQLAGKLRRGKLPVIGYIEKDRFWIDLRAVEPFEEHALIEALRAALS
jgi:L-seryl-tRNA(Ser) seleniumtransferase